MTIFDEWDWGWCKHCRREIELLDGLLKTHFNLMNACKGSFEKPTKAPKEMTRSEEARANR